MTRERMIIDALLAALRTPAITGVIAVYEERGWAVPVEGLPAIDVAATTSEAEVLDVFDAQLAHTLRVDVAIVARETSTLGPSAAADAIVAEAHRRIRQNSALAALVRSVTPARHPVGAPGVGRRAAPAPRHRVRVRPRHHSRRPGNRALDPRATP